MPRRAGEGQLARKLGSRIRALRREVGITQERLAWACDLDKGYLSQVEAGKRLPSVPVLAALAENLSLTMADLVGFDLTVPRLRMLDASRSGGFQAPARAPPRPRGRSKAS